MKNLGRTLSLAGLIGAGSLGSGCALPGASSGPGVYYDCNQLTYQRLPSQADNDMGEALGGLALGILFGASGKPGGAAIGHGFSRYGDYKAGQAAHADRTNQVIKRDWINVPDNSYSAGYLEWNDINQNGIMEISERRFNGRGFNLCKLDGAGVRGMWFSTQVMNADGAKINMYVFRSETPGSYSIHYGSTWIRGNGGKVATFYIPMDKLQTFGPHINFEFRKQIPGQKEGPTFDRYRTTLCCP